MFYPWHAQNHKDSEGKPFRYGFFKCLHTCHEKHPDRAEWFRAIGLDYDAYKESCPPFDAEGRRDLEAANTPEGVNGERGRYEFDRYGAMRFRKWDPKKHELAPAGGPVAYGLRVIARTASPEGNERGLLIGWTDDQGVSYSDVVKAEQYGTNDGNPRLAAGFMSRGLRIKKPGILADFLRNYPSGLLPLITSRNSVGWFKPKGGAPVFVTPSNVIGAKGADVFFSGARSSAAALAERGTPEDWRRKCASWAAYSSRIALALCAAFAAPCLELIGLENGGFNIVGSSSKGKSLVLLLAASVYGRGARVSDAGASGTYVRSWNLSSTEFELCLAGHNDLPSIFDETKLANPKELGHNLYVFNAGTGKGRAMVDATAPSGLGSRERNQWRTLLLSSSEYTVPELIAQGGYGQKAAAGQETRLADLAACPKNPDFGVFERFPEGMSGEQAAEAIEAASTACYGTVGALWLRWLVENREQAGRELRGRYDSFRAKLAEHYPSTQANRVLKRLALCAAAGDLATEIGLTGWAPTLAVEQVDACARSILGAFKVDREKSEAVAALLEAIQSHTQQFPEVFPLSGKRARLGEVRGDRLGSRFFVRAESLCVQPLKLDPVQSLDSPAWEEPQSPENRTPQPDRVGAEEAEAVSALFFFLQLQFNRLVGAGRASDIARWLKVEGVVLTVGAKPNATLSRIGPKYGECAGKTPGYIIDPEALQALAERIAAD